MSFVDTHSGFVLTLPTQPTNIIFTGVAGTGKTHRLLQIQRLYDESVFTSWEAWRTQQLRQYSWCDVLCALFLLEEKLMTVPEMMRHPIIQDKIQANARHDNVNATLWGQLNLHAHPQSKTVITKNRSADYYFDKTEASQWYLLDEVKADLSERLTDLLALYNSKQLSQSTQVISRSMLVSFHQAYGYDEFVEGIRPRIDTQSGQMQYDIQDGAMIQLCKQARQDPTHRYAMLIDEINRANTAQVFGELMSVIEPSKRSDNAMPMSVKLGYSGRQFNVPSNVDIYATMNTQDHSLATLDSAFRRRFEFIECLPDSSPVAAILIEPDSISNNIDDNIENKTANANQPTNNFSNQVSVSHEHEIDLALMMQRINQRLLAILGQESQLGQSYFMGLQNVQQLAQRLQRQIIPQIQAQLKAHLPTAQLLEGLLYILYGWQLNAEGRLPEKLPDKIKDGCCVLELPESMYLEQSTSSQLSSLATSMSHPSALGSGLTFMNPDMSTIISLQQGFLKAAETPNNAVIDELTLAESTVKKSESTPQNIFLTAQPYQLFYADIKL